MDPPAPPPSPPHQVEECRGVLRVFSDGSIVRSPRPSFDVPVRDDGSVIWKDATFHPAHHLQLRLYKPSAASSPTKYPVFYYFHGGGYCIGSRTWPNCQNYCLRLAAELRALVVAPDYRLAPECRLPAAIEDGVAAVEWLREQASSANPDPWLAEADFGRVFISGDSAGGNLAHHLAVRLGAGSPDLAPLRIRGYVLLGPFFGGTARTRSEAESPKDAFFPLELNDRFWRLCLPLGADTDHPLSNRFGPSSPSLEGLDLDPMLVVVGSCDLLRDRAEEYARRLREWGKKVEFLEFPGQQHGFFTIEAWSESSNKLMQDIRKFMAQNA